MSKKRAENQFPFPFAQLDDLNLEAAEEVVGVSNAEAETAAAHALELVEEEQEEEDMKGSPPPPPPPPVATEDAGMRLSVKSTDDDDDEGDDRGEDADDGEGGRQMSRGE